MGIGLLEATELVDVAAGATRGGWLGSGCADGGVVDWGEVCDSAVQALSVAASRPFVEPPIGLASAVSDPALGSVSGTRPSSPVHAARQHASSAALLPGASRNSRSKANGTQRDSAALGTAMRMSGGNARWAITRGRIRPPLRPRSPEPSDRTRTWLAALRDHQLALRGMRYLAPPL
jgi:hypothetical protein